MHMQELAGKTAIVTGAGRGIGAAAARELALAGAALLLAARSTDAVEAVAAEIRAAGGRAQSVFCNVADYSSVENAVRICLAGFGGVDILVNNAGTIEPIARLTDSDPEAWGAALDVNLKGVYHGLRAVIPHMQAGGGGVVVNISSGAATAALEGWSHYCAGKAGALALTRCAHQEYGPMGIRVVGLSPGTVATDMQKTIRASGVNAVSRLDPSAHIPAAWAGKAVRWLCGDGGADWAGRDFPLRSVEGRALVGLPVSL